MASRREGRKRAFGCIGKEVKETVFSQGQILVSPELLEKLQKFGLFRPASQYQSLEQFPGVAWRLPYSFVIDGETHAGFLGFDENMNLLSIDKRWPTSEQIYLRSRKGD